MPQGIRSYLEQSSLGIGVLLCSGAVPSVTEWRWTGNGVYE